MKKLNLFFIFLSSLGLFIGFVGRDIYWLVFFGSCLISFILLSK